MSLAKVGPVGVDGTASIMRWEGRLFGWHFVTVYSIALATYQTPETMETWWISFSENLCFGISLPRKSKS